MVFSNPSFSYPFSYPSFLYPYGYLANQSQEELAEEAYREACENEGIE